MWKMTKSLKSVFFVFKFLLTCFAVLICCFSGPKKNDDGELRSYSNAGKPSLKRIGLDNKHPAYLRNLKNANGNDMVKQGRTEKPQFNVLQKDFHFSAGSRIKRMRRSINPAPASDSRVNNSYSLSNSSVVNATASLPINFLNLNVSTTPVLPEMWPSEDINITMHCESYWFSCRGRCTQERELGGTEERLQCFCDSSCEFFKDCCADFDQYCYLYGISAQDVKTPDYSGQWECVTSSMSFTKVDGVWMISSCPQNWTQVDIKDLCRKGAFLSYENIAADNTPVIDRKGNTYKNRHCAQCHGVNLTDLTFYNFKFSCDVPLPKEYMRKETWKFLSTFCANPFWRPPIGARRRYCHYISPNYNCFDISIPLKVQQKCLDGPVRLVFDKYSFDKRTFLNPYCALCSNVSNFSCGPGSYPSIVDPAVAKPFSLVLDFDFSDQDQQGIETPKIRELDTSCRQQDYVYDFYLDVCRPGISPSDISSVHEKIFVVNIWMYTNATLLWGQPLITEADFKEAIVNKLNLSKQLISNISIGNPFRPVSSVLFHIHFTSTIHKNISTETLQTAMDSISIIPLTYANFTVFKVAVKPFHCARVEKFYPNEYMFEGNVVKIKITGEMFQEAEYYSNETDWINGSLAPTGFLTVCKQPQLNCSGILIGLNEDEYSILPNASLYRNISQEIFPPENFLFFNNTIWICTHFSSIYTASSLEVDRSTTEDDIVLIVLTYAGLSLSILSFILVLVTYTLFKELRTLPGIYLMNLCLALLLADLLYLVTGHVNAKIACTIIAVLLQYFFLVSFTWMSIIAFETWKVFSKIRVQHRRPNRRENCFKLLRRIAIGWLPALVFVIVCVSLDQANAVKIHYGGLKGCFINNSTANLFFFAVPVAFFISFNAIFFALTVKAIRKTNNQARRATHEAAKRKTAVVFLKIFILMGFTWIFGFLRVLVSQYFEYPFIIFTTLQGLYIALAFVITSRVKEMYRSLWRRSNSGSVSEDTRL